MKPEQRVEEIVRGVPGITGAIRVSLYTGILAVIDDATRTQRASGRNQQYGLLAWREKAREAQGTLHAVETLAREGLAQCECGGDPAAVFRAILAQTRESKRG